VFCVHDADAPGTMIYQTLQEETKARGARKIKIINLGLDPWEAVEMGLEVETLEEPKRVKPVADYVREQGDNWEDWLQTHRVELNAMTTPQFIEWLDVSTGRGISSLWGVQFSPLGGDGDQPFERSGPPVFGGRPGRLIGGVDD
jgi:hypothetical protein